MKCYTVHLSKWRKVRKDGYFLLDSTTKTGDKVFAPGWDIVLGHKDKSITDEEYTAVYVERMRQSYRENQEHWHELFRYPKVVIGCYCTPGNFCHRYLLVKFFEGVAKKQGFDFQYEGELYLNDETEGKGRA